MLDSFYPCFVNCKIRFCLYWRAKNKCCLNSSQTSLHARKKKHRCFDMTPAIDEEACDWSGTRTWILFVSILCFNVRFCFYAWNWALNSKKDMCCFGFFVKTLTVFWENGISVLMPRTIRPFQIFDEGLRRAGRDTVGVTPPRRRPVCCCGPSASACQCLLRQWPSAAVCCGPRRRPPGRGPGGHRCRWHWRPSRRQQQAVTTSKVNLIKQIVAAADRGSLHIITWIT
jgi:hypothetical protein